jgi:type VI secretion system secreted protein VgrG
MTGREPQFFFRSEEFPDDELEVYAFSGAEGISQIYLFHVDLVTRHDDVTFEKLINKPAWLLIRGPFADRFVHGIVTRLEHVARTSRHSHYRALLAPPHARLGLTRRLRIFQDRTTQEIVTTVLEDARLGGGAEWRLKGSYKPRNYCVQYRETDLAFIQRLLEEEGFAFHFEHEESELRLVFDDDSSALQPITDPSTLPFRPPEGTVTDEEHVDGFFFGRRMAVGKVQLTDYSFKRPSTAMTARAEAEQPTFEIYDYPGEFVDTELADRLASVRLEEAQVGRETGHGSSDCNRLIAGRRFTLSEHPQEELNQEYLVLQLSSTGTQPQVLEEHGGEISYGNTMTVIPAVVPYRPPRQTARPVVLGMHPARVVGPQGEEVYVDSFGRIKVQFLFDREGEDDERSSCWIRVAQPWAGAGYGAMFLPRVGHEVLVAFLEGDPDRPIVVGRVHNGENPHPCALPGGKTVSTIRSSSSPGGGGFNELRFEDRKGCEEVFVHAERDYNLVVKNSRTSSIGSDHTEQVGRDRSVRIGRDSEHHAKTMLIEATEKITLKVGETFIEITPRKIRAFSGGKIKTASVGVTEIKGSLVKINS